MAACAVLSPSFPDIAGLADFKPCSGLYSLVKDHGAGVTLLHSHHGCSELVYEGNRSRPVRSEADKAGATPCSWFVDEQDQFVAYEWTRSADILLKTAPALTPQLATGLASLEASLGYRLGVTYRAGRSCVEVEVEDEPGAHLYLPKSAINYSAVERSVVTCLSLPRDGGELSEENCAWDCVWSNGHHYRVCLRKGDAGSVLEPVEDTCYQGSDGKHQSGVVV